MARICIEKPSARELHSFISALMGWDGRSRILQRHVSERHGYAVFRLSVWNRPCGRSSLYSADLPHMLLYDTLANIGWHCICMLELRRCTLNSGIPRGKLVV